MRLPYRIPGSLGLGDARLAGRDLALRRGSAGGSGSPSTSIIIISVVAAVFVVVVVTWILLRGRNKARKGFTKHYGYSQARDFDDSTATNARSGRNRAAHSGGSETTSTNRQSMVSAAVDRNTSVRSVMTLPAYSHKANANEQVLGREGERDGVDIVLEMTTAEEEEAMREDEMEALYQVRHVRRQEIEETRERRRLRREARSRGDVVALRHLSEQALAAGQASAVPELREEVSRIQNRRQRALSSVSYADLGVARPDGTRLRANSQESERTGLLSDAASIAALSARSPSALSHRRERSASSVLSFDSNQDFPSPALPRSGATTPRRLSAQHTARGSVSAGSSPELIGEADLADSGMPLHEPPRYDEVRLSDERSRSGTPAFNEPPPDYPGPAEARDRRLSDHVADMVENVDTNGDLSDWQSPTELSSASSSRPSPRLAEIPRLPSLRIGLPQIVIEPSSANPDRAHDRE